MRPSGHRRQGTDCFPKTVNSMTPMTVKNSLPSLETSILFSSEGRGSRGARPQLTPLAPAASQEIDPAGIHGELLFRLELGDRTPLYRALYILGPYEVPGPWRNEKGSLGPGRSTAGIYVAPLDPKDPTSFARTAPWPTGRRPSQSDAIYFAHASPSGVRRHAKYASRTLSDSALGTGPE